MWRTNNVAGLPITPWNGYPGVWPLCTEQASQGALEITTGQRVVPLAEEEVTSPLSRLGGLQAPLELDTPPAPDPPDGPVVGSSSSSGRRFRIAVRPVDRAARRRVLQEERKRVKHKACSEKSVSKCLIDRRRLMGTSAATSGPPQSKYPIYIPIDPRGLDDERTTGGGAPRERSRRGEKSWCSRCAR